MQQAVYSPQRVGHYALASEHYTHFTSPIRRYPDLTVHRLLDMYLHGRLRKGGRPAGVPSFDDLVELGQRCSATERRAEEAERELRTIKVLEYLRDRLGEIVGGVVSGVTQFGVFVQIERFGAEGLVHLENLPDDWWHFSRQHGCLVGERSGTRIAIGDAVRVQIASVDVGARKLDLVLAEHRGAPRVGRSVRPGGAARTESTRSTASRRARRAPRRTGRGRGKRH
jgi:ribonuclease R